MKPIEESTHKELKEQLKRQLVSALFDGTLNDFITIAIGKSIQWAQAEEERQNIKTKRTNQMLLRVEHSDLSKRAINCLLSQKWTTLKQIQRNVKSLKDLTAIRNCGRHTANEIITYYELKVTE